MPIDRLLKDSSLEEVAILNRAFDLALRALGLVDRNDPITEMVARKIIEAGRSGLRDPVGIAEAALQELRPGGSQGNFPRGI